RKCRSCQVRRSACSQSSFRARLFAGCGLHSSTQIRLPRHSQNVNLLWRGIYVLYPGETVCLVNALSEVALPRQSEGTVIRVVRDDQDLAVAAEVNFHTRSGALVVTVPLEALQAAVSRAGQDRTAVVWGLSKTVEEVMEAAMHSMLDAGFSMDRGLNL